jgi:hypothetical protein
MREVIRRVARGSKRRERRSRWMGGEIKMIGRKMVDGGMVKGRRR